MVLDVSTHEITTCLTKKQKLIPNSTFLKAFLLWHLCWLALVIWGRAKREIFFFSFYIFFPEASVSDIPGKRLLDKMNLWSYPVWVFCILWGQKFMSRLKGLQPNSSFQRVLRYTFESEYDTGCVKVKGLEDLVKNW